MAYNIQSASYFLQDYFKFFLSAYLVVCILTYFQCAIYTCEAMERDKLKLSEQYFTQLASKHTEALDSLLAASLPDQAVLLKLTGNSAVFSFRIYRIMGYFHVAKFLRFCLKNMGIIFRGFYFLWSATSAKK